MKGIFTREAALGELTDEELLEEVRMTTGWLRDDVVGGEGPVDPDMLARVAEDLGMLRAELARRRARQHQEVALRPSERAVVVAGEVMVRVDLGPDGLMADVEVERGRTIETLHHVVGVGIAADGRLHVRRGSQPDEVA